MSEYYDWGAGIAKLINAKIINAKRLAEIRGRALAYFDKIRKDERLWR